jgi:hypothetical protein
VRLVAILFAVVILALAALIFAQGYVGRVALRDSQLAGCQRGKLDRAANARGWRTAEAARRASGSRSDLIAAERYDRIASGLEQRSRIDCKTAFPPVRLLGK